MDIYLRDFYRRNIYRRGIWRPTFRGREVERGAVVVVPHVWVKGEELSWFLINERDEFLWFLINESHFRGPTFRGREVEGSAVIVISRVGVDPHLEEPAQIQHLRECQRALAQGCI
jgi:hypothetical protein